ncbi:ribonuclease P protein component [Vreelandella utahensis]|uniref:ribonuclease P protein component n=1 Tax=Vreelandella halophila TaxID=86177 RepID=UPI001FE5047E|nr:ribonuclease P protein component [Halomonas utahensis]
MPRVASASASEPVQLPPDFRFPRQARLLNSRDYTRVFDNVEFRAGSRGFLMLARTVDGSRPLPRLGIIVARRHLPRATTRNRFKRAVRESFRHRQHDLPALDVIVLARPGGNTMDNAELFQELDRAWRKLGKQATSRSPAKTG